MAEEQMDHPNINRNIHPPVVTLIYILIALFLGKFAPIPFLVPQFLKIAGFGIIVTGFVFGAGAFVEFRKANTTLDPHGSVKAVVSNGVYRITRNPIYLGFLLLLIGFPVYLGSYWGVVVSPFFIATMNRFVIEKEEAYLEKKFGEQYAGYKSRVRRWL